MEVLEFIFIVAAITVVLLSLIEGAICVCKWFNKTK